MTAFKKIVFATFFILIDIVIWIIIGLALLNYEDFYDETEGPYFSLVSMTALEKIAYFSYYIWVFLNIALVIYFTNKFVKKYVIKS